MLVLFFAGGTGSASDDGEALSEAISKQVKLKGTPQNDQKGVQAYIRVDAVGVKQDPFGDWIWHELDSSRFVSMKSMRSWPPNYENTNLIVEGILLVDVISKEQVQRFYQEIVKQSGHEEIKQPVINDIKSYIVERYTWQVDSPEGEQAGAR